MTKLWISSFISAGYAALHIWLLRESIWLAQLWYAVFWHCRWMMTWGNGLEEHWNTVSKKKYVRTWQCTSLTINVKQASWPIMYIVMLKLATCVWQQRLGHCHNAKTCACVNVRNNRSRKVKENAGASRNPYWGTLELTEKQARIHTAVHPRSQRAAVHTSYTLLRCIWNEKS